MDAQMFKNYLIHVQKLSSQLEDNPGAHQELLHYIEISKDSLGLDPSYAEFFKGEYAYYSGNYERALKHYLEAKGVDMFEFYCYRASAQISKANGHLDKAVTFAKNALGLIPDDYSTLAFLGNLSQVLGGQKVANEYLNKSKIITNNVKTENESASAGNSHKKKSITENEFKELAGIFSSSTLNEALFAGEQPQSAARYSSVSVDLFSSALEPVISNETESAMDQFENIDISIEANNELIADRVTSFQRYHNNLISSYLEQWSKRPLLLEHALYILKGWGTSLDAADGGFEFLTENGREPSGGFFLRWNRKGIVINPGKGFLRNFHRNGLHIKDIDYVIVTDPDPEASIDIKQIYELAFLLNQSGNEPRVIHYYLNQKAYQAYRGFLKPRYKQERYAIHNLELFDNVSEIEKVELSTDITLHYFLAESSKSTDGKAKESPASNLGIRLELSFSRDSLFHNIEGENGVVNIGYVSGVCWSERLARYLDVCDVLLAGIGNTNKADYQKTAYIENHLGYFGIASLLDELTLKLLVCTGFSGREGDLRLELIKKLRRENSRYRQGEGQTTVLPGDNGLVIDLKTNKVKCSSTGRFVDAEDIRVLRSAEMFSPLLYLSPACYL